MLRAHGLRLGLTVRIQMPRAPRTIENGRLGLAVSIEMARATLRKQRWLAGRYGFDACLISCHRTPSHSHRSASAVERRAEPADPPNSTMRFRRVSSIAAAAVACRDVRTRHGLPRILGPTRHVAMVGAVRLAGDAQRIPGNGIEHKRRVGARVAAGLRQLAPSLAVPGPGIANEDPSS